MRRHWLGRTMPTSSVRSHCMMRRMHRVSWVLEKWRHRSTGMMGELRAIRVHRGTIGRLARLSMAHPYELIGGRLRAPRTPIRSMRTCTMRIGIGRSCRGASRKAGPLGHRRPISPAVLGHFIRVFVGRVHTLWRLGRRCTA